MTITTGRAAPPAPACRDWQTRAACASGALDLTWLTDAAADKAAQTGGTYVVHTRAGLTARDYAADLAQARALCAGCPVLEQCRANALAVTDYAGFAGGLTETQRRRWRQRRKITVRPLSVADFIDTGELTPVWVAERAEADGQGAVQVPRATYDLVVHLTTEGVAAALIAARLGVPESIVHYARAVSTGAKPMPAHWRPQQRRAVS